MQRESLQLLFAYLPSLFLFFREKVNLLQRVERLQKELGDLNDLYESVKKELYETNGKEFTESEIDSFADEKENGEDPGLESDTEENRLIEQLAHDDHDHDQEEELDEIDKHTPTAELNTSHSFIPVQAKNGDGDEGRSSITNGIPVSADVLLDTGKKPVNSTEKNKDSRESTRESRGNNLSLSKNGDGDADGNTLKVGINEEVSLKDNPKQTTSDDHTAPTPNLNAKEAEKTDLACADADIVLEIPIAVEEKKMVSNEADYYPLLPTDEVALTVPSESHKPSGENIFISTDTPAAADVPVSDVEKEKAEVRRSSEECTDNFCGNRWR
jgi:hypothetical protein